MGRVGLLVAAAVGAAAVAVVVLLPRGAEPSERDRVAGCAADRACLDRVYARAARNGNVAAALAALASDASIDDCHLEAHRLAHAVYRVVGNVERAFLLGGPQCRFGYLHGAVEASGSTPAAGRPSTHGVAIPRCGRLRHPVERRACAHGFGHALMLRTRNDIRASLSGCLDAGRHSLSAPACTAGVMMENSLRFAGTSSFPRAAAAGCSVVGRRPPLRHACFDNVGIVAALAVDHDRSRALALCGRLDQAADRALCTTGATDEIAEASGR